MPDDPMPDDPMPDDPMAGDPVGDGTRADGTADQIRQYRRIAGAVLEALPVAGHDLSPEGITEQVGVCQDALEALDGVDDTVLDAQDRVDLELIRTEVSARLWTATELTPQSWDPLVHLPDPSSLIPLTAPGTDPAVVRRAVTVRVAAIPTSLRVARDQLAQMPLPHLEAAVERIGVVRAAIDHVASEAGGLTSSEGSRVSAACEVADRALVDHAAWLADRAAVAEREPRSSHRVHAARLWYLLDTPTSPEALLTRIESDLMALEEGLAQTCSRIEGAPADPDQVRRVLTGPLADPAAGETARAAASRAARAIRDADLVEVPDDLADLIEQVGPYVGSAACLTMASGQHHGPDRGEHAVRIVAGHVAVPGHALQLAHARRFVGSTPVRAALPSDTFVEGWAGYAESLLARADWIDAADGLALRATQVVGALRAAVAAVVDVRAHTRDLAAPEAVALLTSRAHLSQSAAEALWRRVLVSPGRSVAAAVGHVEISELLAELGRARPQLSARERHDLVLAHGSPAPRHVRALLDL